MKHWFTSLLLSVFLGMIVQPFTAQGGAFDDIEQNIDAWRLTEAEKLVQKLPKKDASSPVARYLRGKLLFYQGDIQGGLVELRKAIEGARTEIAWKALRDFVASAEPMLKSMGKKTSADGRFLFRFASPSDALILPYAEDTLTKQSEALLHILGDELDYPLEVIFLRDVASLAALTGLTVDQIERTGTVAVTKYARIIMLSPQVLATGYPWLDTLAHELTHVSITRVSKDNAPIWLHEGLSKLYEQRWQKIPTGTLTPEEAYLLDRASKEGRLIPLRNLHPSIAHLPDQESAVLAYAQLLSFCRYVTLKLGDKWAKKILSNLAKGETMDSAFKAAFNQTLKRYYQWWKQIAQGTRQTPIPVVELMKRRFHSGETGEADSLESILDLKVRKILRIGDLLRGKGHVQAAYLEYQEADTLLGSPSPAIRDRLGACLLELNKPEEAARVLTEVAMIYPSHGTTFAELARAKRKLGDHEAAAKYLEKAIAINPFHPAIHCDLADSLSHLGKKIEAEQEARICTAILSQDAM